MTYRNKKLLEACRLIECQRCRTDDGTVVGAHSNQLRDGKGRGIKSKDSAIASLCYACHMEIDQGKGMSKQERHEAWDEAHRGTMQTLVERGILEVKK